jgi:AraC-like DNA-binding protein
MRHPLVWDPLVESLIHGLLLVAGHPYRQALAAFAQPGPAAVRNAMDRIEAGPHLPLTTSTLARQCHVSVRALQEGFRRQLGMSPMAYLRVVRLRRAHRDLRSADPSHSSVASIAHRWGFTHLGPVRRRAQGDVRRNTATSPARCPLISPIRSAFVSAQRNGITIWSSCRFPFAVRRPRFCTCRPSSATRVRLTN